MPGKAATVLIALAVLNFASVVLADTPASMMPDDRTTAVHDTAKPLTAKDKGLSAASQRAAVQSARFRRDGIAKPDNVNAMSQLAHFYERQGKTDEAATALS